MKWLAVAVIANVMIASVLIVSPVLAQGTAGPSTAMTPAPDDRAKQWLTLVDDANYTQAYQQAGATLRERASAAKFQADIGGVRKPMGAMATRSLKDIKMTKSLPAMRSGQYAIVRFDSSFAHRIAAIETITLTSGKDGWSVIGYHID